MNDGEKSFHVDRVDRFVLVVYCFYSLSEGSMPTSCAFFLSQNSIFRPGSDDQGLSASGVGSRIAHIFVAEKFCRKHVLQFDKFADGRVRSIGVPTLHCCATHAHIIIALRLQLV
jgi:hypothetical protein